MERQVAKAVIDLAKENADYEHHAGHHVTVNGFTITIAREEEEL